ncbi:50S ribosomal protein L15 [Mycoplasma sp. ATU-Cv-508]|uniref:50S ribosomal protein L15 n=1 Tax=Mycoplasma sp. ATU-Cv-508 TaxID=2048001 RepID=UPI000FDD7EC0
MQLHTLQPKEGARQRKIRVARGHAGRRGKQAGRGQSGQNKRGSTRPGFEGGQNPWFRRLPKRGFKNVNHVEYQIVSLTNLSKKFPVGAEVDRSALKKAGLIASTTLPVKVLANGKLTHKLNLKINAISKTARQAVEKAGGKVEVL